MSSMVGNFPRLTTFEQKEGVAGVCLTGPIKRLYQINMVDALFDGSLRFDRDFFTISRKKNRPMHSDDMIALAREQMERFHWEHKASQDAHGKDRWAMTGKLGEKQDDALLALLMVYTWTISIMTNLRYRPFVQRVGGTRRGVVVEVSKAVMKSFQSLKNTAQPENDLQKKLADIKYEGKNKTKRMRGDPNTVTDMTGDLERGTTKRMKLTRPGH